MIIVLRNGKKVHVSDSNKKLIPSKDTNFMIFNLPAIRTCPYATPMCKIACYAVKAERAYPDCLPSRWDNFNASKTAEFVEAMIETIVKRVNNMRKQELIVRIHESGDFYSREYAMKWIEIARFIESYKFKKGKKVTFIAYTKSFVFFDGVELPSNFRLRASIWADTDPEQVKIILRNQWPIYTAVDSFSDADTFTQCRCSDCATCGKCWGSDPDIRCEIH